MAAADSDRAYFRLTGTEGGMYDLMYYCHNLHFLVSSHLMQGRFAEAKKTADELVARAGPVVPQAPMGEFYLPTPLFVLLRFHRWDEILRTPAPDARWTTTTGLWHFAR